MSQRLAFHQADWFEGRKEWSPAARLSSRSHVALGKILKLMRMKLLAKHEMSHEHVSPEHAWDADLGLKRITKTKQFNIDEVTSCATNFPFGLFFQSGQLLALKHLNFLGNRYFKSYSSLYQSWKALPLPVFLTSSQDSCWVYKVSCRTTIRSWHYLFLTVVKTEQNVPFSEKNFWLCSTLYCWNSYVIQTTWGVQHYSTFA